VRFAELSLLALPFAVFVAWRLMAPSIGPPRVLVIAVTVAVGAMAVVLLVLRYEEAEPLGSRYVPARLEDGRIVPGRVEQAVPGRVEPDLPGRVESSTPGQVPRDSVAR
jgi:Family of unknown function (DUF6111)